MEQLARMVESPEHAIVIHYSCESFYDREDGTSPRITSIAVRNLGSGQTVSFSIHQTAEIRQIPLEQIEQNFDTLERETLDRFYEYVRAHTGYHWLHWNMRDINYGFQAIDHRYRVLGGTPVEIPESSRFDLARAMVAIFGIGYVGHPRLPKLTKKNRISDKDFLVGKDEAEAFRNRQYYQLHLSTLRKVDVIANIAERADSGTLKTNSRWSDRFRLYPQAAGEWLKEHWLPSLVFALLTIISFVLGLSAQWR
jgi:hypothetical protein